MTSSRVVLLLSARLDAQHYHITALLTFQEKISQHLNLQNSISFDGESDANNNMIFKESFQVVDHLADDGRKNSSESSYYAYIYCYFYVFTQLHKSLKYWWIIVVTLPLRLQLQRVF